jgi:hypothetical protein
MRPARGNRAPASSVGALTALLCCALAACSDRRPPSQYIFPDDFEGWVWIAYEDPAGDPLPLVDGREVVEIPVCGVRRTSSRLEGGWATDTYFFQEVDGLRGIDHGPGDHHERGTWHGATVWHNDGPPSKRFFFGAKQNADSALPVPESAKEVEQRNCGVSRKLR